MSFRTQKFVKMKLSPDEVSAIYEFTNILRIDIFEELIGSMITDDGREKALDRAELMEGCGSVMREVTRHYRKLEDGVSSTLMFRIQEVHAVECAMTLASTLTKAVVRSFKKDGTPVSEGEWLDIIAGLQIKAMHELQTYEYHYEEGEYLYE